METKFEGLVKRARIAQNMEPEQFRVPKWHEIGRVLSALEIRDGHTPDTCRYCKSNLATNAGAGPGVLSVVAFAVMVIAAVEKAAFVAGVAVILLFAFAFLLAFRRGQSWWKEHRLMFEAQQRELEAKGPEEALVPYLKAELEKTKDAVLGEKSPLQTLAQSVKARREALHAMTYELDTTMKEPGVGAMKDVLAVDMKNVTDDLGALAEKEGRVADHIARTTAKYHALVASIDALSPKMRAERLHERVQTERQAAQDVLDRADEILDASMEDIDAQCERFRQLASATVVETAQRALMAAPSERFDEAFDACDRLMEQGIGLLSASSTNEP